MTLDEAILHAREVAERNRNQYKNCPSDRTDIRHQTCEECAEEHEQLAEWLEELKKYREIGTVEECKNSVLKILEAYNKAIDDFKEELFKNSERVRPVGRIGYSEVLTCEKIYDIAEQLKAGIAND